ncbi:MAG: pantetheine-phosphate adenylyltransferase [bacterium]
MEKIAVYPGSFDPPTNGHVDLIERGSKIFDKLIIAILENSHKEVLFSSDEKIEMLKEIIKKYSNVEVIKFKGLLTSFLKKIKAKIVIRGLRTISDFEYEFQMSLMNKELNEKIETIFFMPSKENLFISSKLIKEIAKHQGNLSHFVPFVSEQKLKEKFSF